MKNIFTNAFRQDIIELAKTLDYRIPMSMPQFTLAFIKYFANKDHWIASVGITQPYVSFIIKLVEEEYASRGEEPPLYIKRGKKGGVYRGRIIDHAHPPPPPPKPRHPFQVYLDVLSMAAPFTEKDLKVAFREAVKKVHPDVGGSDEAFIKVTKAYEILLKYLNKG